MTSAAPRLDPRLIEELGRLAQSRASAAEIRRALVARALELRLAPPSYEHVRRLVVRERLDCDAEAGRASEVLPVALEVALGIEHGNELLRVARGEMRRRR